jgi:hypothetical protein
VEALDIPLGARILGVADAYEAMTSARPYRKTPLSHEIAVSELEKYAGIQFDPEVVPVLVGLPREILDRPPERPDELPTMLHRDDAKITPSPSAMLVQATPMTPAERAAAAASAPANAAGLGATEPGPAPTHDEGNPPQRPALASDDVP